MTDTALPPVLVMQTRRMGDLILTFPLLLALQRLLPGHPLWVVGEAAFFKPLMPLAPQVVFFPPGHLPVLARQRYRLAINLSPSVEAADCLANVEADIKLGLMRQPGGLRVAGHWQLYRLALTQNNHHNCFHWADLFRMDVVPHSQWPGFERMHPRPPHGKIIGLVLGASEPGKRPSVRFWTHLARILVGEGLVPILLGGPAEREMGEEVARQLHLPKINSCGKLHLGETAALMRSLSLCITPDTGPMHLADWLNVPVLDLSMGPVEARETGPVSPGQYVLRPAMSCVGCWQCQRGKYPCRQLFSPAAVARVALSLLRQEPLSETAKQLHGLRLLQSGRDALGLYRLTPLVPPSTGSPASARSMLEAFWRAVFLGDVIPGQQAEARAHAAQLARDHPRLHHRLRLALARLCSTCAGGLKRSGSTLPPAFWHAHPPMLRLFAGHLHMTLQNEDFSPAAWQKILSRLTAANALLA